ncbi:hypothetical protein [Methylocystis sp.]|uniref:hypothetical protein n=1 Tax=Methylocystis sp. TaxID=1911079 RepID=UPI003D0EE049
MPLSEILKTIEKSPTWETLAKLPAQLEALERRVAALEAAFATPSSANAVACPACGAAMKFVGERPDPTFGRLGFKEHQFQCECGYRTTRQWSQQKGYR